VTDLFVCQIELPRNSGRGSGRSPQSSNIGLTSCYPPSLLAPAGQRAAPGSGGRINGAHVFMG